jgi:hypothetical protein
MPQRRRRHLSGELSFLYKRAYPLESLNEEIGGGVAESIALVAMSTGCSRTLKIWVRATRSSELVRTHIRSRSPR